MKTAIFLGLLLLIGCNTEPLFYQGYVYYGNKPLENVTVKKEYINETTKTDSSGYFKLNKDPDFLTKLIFIKEKFEVDTVRTIWSSGGEKISYTFLNEDFDTLRLIKTLPNNNHK